MGEKYIYERYGASEYADTSLLQPRGIGKDAMNLSPRTLRGALLRETAGAEDGAAIL